jgi:Fic family protein
MNNIIELWKPIEFNEKLWLGSDTSNVDNLVPSWLNKRESLQKENGEYSQFITRLKRQHAIETGIIEKLYDLSIGVTETFIKEGFIESYLGHDDTNIPPQQLLGYLTDHFFAMDFIFDLVKNNKPLTKGFIKELHGLITKQQETITAVDPFGKLLKIPLLRGEFKTNENNPRRVDGTIIRYCPPIHVDSEIEKLVQIFQELCSRKINVVITSAWFHHAFTQIHPFQDGNGRIARLLSSLIFIKEGLFPFTVKRNERTEYIQALEFADLGQVEKLVSFFGDVQKNNIEAALNYKQEKASNTILEAAKIFGAKVEEYNQQQEQARKKRLENNKNAVFDFV